MQIMIFIHISYKNHKFPLIVIILSLLIMVNSSKNCVFNVFWHVKLKLFLIKIIGWTITKFLIYICLYLDLKKAKYYYYNEKRWENTNECRCFFGKIYFLSSATIKFYQTSNFSPKNNMFSTFSRKWFTKNQKIITFG